MAVDQERGAQGQSGMHRQGFTSVELDQDEALPAGAVAVAFRLQAVEERLLELEDVFHMHADDERLGRGDGSIGEDDVFELVGAGGKDRGAFVDLGGIEEIEDRKVLNLEDLVHAFKAEATLPVEEVRDMGLFETGLLGKTEPG